MVRSISLLLLLHETPSYMELTDSASDIAWDRVVNTPNTLAGYGITSMLLMFPKLLLLLLSNKILKLDSNGKLPTDITGDAATLEGHDASYFATAEGIGSAEDRLDTAESEIDTFTGRDSCY